MEENEEKAIATVKIISKSKSFLDQVKAFLEIGFRCDGVSKKMYSQETDEFFQFVNLAKKEA